MSSMEYIRLRNCANYIKGFAFSSKDFINDNTQKMVVRVSDFTIDSISRSEAVYLEESDKYKTFILNEGDILIQTVGSWANNPNSIVGKVVRVPKECEGSYLNQNIVKIIPHDINANYLFYALKANRFSTYCVMRGQGAANQASVTLDTIFKFRFPIHSLQEQDKIAKILSAYEELIENNNKRIKILEQMAENLYKEWFVRLRNPCQIVTHMGKVRDLCYIKSGYAFKSEDWRDTGCKVVKIKDLDGSFVNSVALDCVSSEVADKAKKFRLCKGDLTIAMTGATIGKIGLIIEDELYTNQRVGKFFVGKKYIPYLYCFFKQNHIVESILALAGSSSAQPNISGEDLEKIDMPFNMELIDKFSKVVKPIFNEMIILLNENENLIKQRDMLLPRLMSGKLELKQSQEKVVAFKPKLTFAEFKNGFAAAARKDSGLTEQDMEELYKAYCDDSRDE